MTKEEFIKFHSEICDHMKGVVKSKNSDYTGNTPGAFVNLQMCESMDIAETAQGILVRMTDKMSRLNSFRQKGILLVEDESIEDTCVDLANYAILFAGYVRSQRKVGNES